MIDRSASAAAIRRLQTLYSKWSAGQVLTDSRAERLAWASQNVGRRIASFKQLTSREATALIDVLQASLGQRPTNDTPTPGRQYAHARGTEGRRGAAGKSVTLATADDIGAIDAQLIRLGWDRARLESFLRSPSSPTGGRTVIRTLADANRVRWALKRIIERGQKRAG